MYTHNTIHVYSYINVNPYSYNLASKACFEIRRDIFIDFEFVVVSTSTLSVIVFDFSLLFGFTFLTKNLY